ncbi:MAG: hypothetical protein Q7U57_12435 [Methylovulum sp.]|nr:hypothetical protein [Methylovulum sp.]
MSQEITIIVMIDTAAAINANTLEGNIYLVDNLKTEGSEGEGTGQLNTAVNGAHWIDGSQSGEHLLNWLPSGIGSLPPSLPRTFHQHKSKLIDRKNLLSIKNMPQMKGLQSAEDFSKELHRISQTIGSTSNIKDAHGNVSDLGIKVMNIFGEPFIKDQEPSSNISYLPPLITNITGEAVDKGVIFPAQYGTPISIKDGWYWSASVDTNKTGNYAYTLHISIYKLSYIGEMPTWEPIKMTHESYLNVTSAPKKNGFTHGAMAELPILQISV